MSAHSNLDRESFQNLLASAFTVQESQLDTQSLSAIVGIQRLISAGALDVNGATHLIADRTREVANAAGVAISLLQADRLVCRVRSGIASTNNGWHIMASLRASGDTTTNREILRVENAQTDKRIEAAICRQFGAMSLLILLIHHDGAVVGLMEVLFSEAHAFQEHEVCTYQLMANLVEDAMSHDIQLDRKEASVAEPSTLPRAIAQATAQMQNFSRDRRVVPDTPINRATAMTVAAAQLPAPGQLAGAARMITRRVEHNPLPNPKWNFAAAAVVITLVMASWIAYSHRSPASTLVPSAVPSARGTNALEPPNPMLANNNSTAQTALVATKGRAAKATFERVPIGENEVDFIAEDVTIRYFSPNSAPRQVVDKEIYIGEDVTVRYLAPPPAVVPPARPVLSAAQPVERSPRVPEHSIRQK